MQLQDFVYKQSESYCSLFENPVSEKRETEFRPALLDAKLQRIHLLSSVYRNFIIYCKLFYSLNLMS
jgi:hypothetical protein